MLDRLDEAFAGVAHPQDEGALTQIALRGVEIDRAKTDEPLGALQPGKSQEGLERLGRDLELQFGFQRLETHDLDRAAGIGAKAT